MIHGRERLRTNSLPIMLCSLLAQLSTLQALLCFNKAIQEAKITQAREKHISRFVQPREAACLYNTSWAVVKLTYTRCQIKTNITLLAVFRWPKVSMFLKNESMKWLNQICSSTRTRNRLRSSLFIKVRGIYCRSCPPNRLQLQWKLLLQMEVAMQQHNQTIVSNRLLIHSLRITLRVGT